MKNVYLSLSFSIFVYCFYSYFWTEEKINNSTKRNAGFTGKSILNKKNGKGKTIVKMKVGDEMNPGLPKNEKKVKRFSSKIKNNYQLDETNVGPINKMISSRSYLLEIRTAYRNGNFQRTIDLAKGSFDQIDTDFSDTWAHGDFLHWTYILIGKSYLKLGNTKKAEEYLLYSIDQKVIGLTARKEFSPFLYSSGPDRSLAYDLFKIGRVEIVKKYFQLSKSFWKVGIELGEIDQILINLNSVNHADEYYEKMDNPNFPLYRYVFGYGAYE